MSGFEPGTLQQHHDVLTTELHNPYWTWSHLALCHTVVGSLPLVSLEEHTGPLLLLLQLLHGRLHLLHK